ncbi:MAG TPA: hypothetical protein PLY93_08810 [Turneriella sp.]|nr:hypothetical protein [Turneriella sp.]
MPNTTHERSEDALADGIADFWQKLDSDASKNLNAEEKKNESLILEWAGKLSKILQGKK